MGLSNIEVLCKELIGHGMSAEMPAAVIQKGTTRNQKVFTGTISNLAQIAEENQVAPPTIIIIGEVVKLHKKLRWFKTEEYEATKSSVLFD